MRRLLMCALAIAAVSTASTSFAETKWTKDLASNNRTYVEVTCPKKSWAVGVGYIMYNRGDSVDAITVICRDKNGRESSVEHEDFLNSDEFTLKITCPANEEFIGLYYKDLPHGDAMAGATVICKGSNGTHQIYNKDLGNSKHGVEIIKEGKERIIGVAFKDLEHNDKADGVTIITK